MKYCKTYSYSRGTITSSEIENELKKQLLESLLDKLENEKIYTIKFSSKTRIDKLTRLTITDCYVDIEASKEMQVVEISQDEKLSMKLPKDKSFIQRFKTAFSYVFSKKFRCQLEKKYKTTKENNNE